MVDLKTAADDEYREWSARADDEEKTVRLAFLAGFRHGANFSGSLERAPRYVPSWRRDRD